MNLSDDLISQFAKLTVGDKKTRSETTVFGTVKDYAKSKYVQIDGSELLTPVSSTTDVIDGDRVTVLIKDHTATITGNLTSPSARLEYVEGVDNKVEGVKKEIAEFDTVVAEMVVAEVGKFDEVIAGKVDAAIVEADLVKTEYLEANYITTQKFEAEIAEIGKLDVETLNANYAQIDFANIGEAAVKKLFADYGLIKDLMIKDGAITGELDAVTINGDLINANTLKADRLVLKGTDGLYYQLNVNGVGEGEIDENGIEIKQTDENSINGSKIQAESITASKIKVTDLSAFGATIGGFQIGDDYIRSHAKGDVHNTNPGIYMDKLGQFAFGGGTDYIKYYQDENGEWKMAFKASEFTFDVSPGVSIGEAVGNTIVLTEEEFYQSDSPTELSGGEWSTAQPTWTEGKYIWRRTKNTYNKKDQNDNPVSDYTPSENGVCITGNSGADGESPVDVVVSPSVIVINSDSTGIPEQTIEIIPRVYKDGQLLYSDIINIIDLPTGMEFSNTGEVEYNDIKTTTAILTIKPEMQSKSGSIRIGMVVDGYSKLVYKYVPYTVVRDGEKGEDGETPLTLKTDPEILFIPVSSSGLVKEDLEIRVNFLASKGSYAYDADGTFNKLPDGWNYVWINNGIKLQIPKDWSSVSNTTDYITFRLYDNENGETIGNINVPLVFVYDGEPGIGVASITEKYQISADNSNAPNDWEDAPLVPTSDKPYLWNYEIITYSDDTVSKPHKTESAKRIIGMYGSEGRGISSITNYYTTTAKPTDTPTDWKTNMQTTSVDKPYLWAKEVITYTSGDPKTTDPIIIGTHGATGEKGDKGDKGDAGVSYSMTANVYAIARTTSGKYIPESITLYGRKQSGVDSISPYDGRFEIAYTLDNDEWKSGYTSDSNQNTVTYSVPDGIKALRCSFYMADGVTLLDEQVIPVVSDGDGYTVILTNESHTFAASADGNALPDQHATCKVFAYKGGSRVAAEIVSISGQVNGLTTSITTNNTTQSEFKVSVNSSMTTTNGTLTIVIKVDGKTFEKQMTYTLALAGAKGDPGDSLQVKYLNSATTPTITNNNVSLWSDAVPAPENGKKTYMTQKLTGAMNWSTPIQISGEDGTTPTVSINSNGYWVINGDTTTVKAQGGTPTITVGTNGNWLVDGKDTGTKAQGEQGKDGADIEYVYYRSQNAVSLSTPKYTNGTLTSGWTTSPRGITATYKYEYASVRKKAAGSTSWGSFSTPIIWSKWGEKGTDGDGIEYKYYLKNNSTKPSYSPSDTKWTDEPTGVSETNMYEYVVQITHHGDGSDDSVSDVALWSKWGQQGDPGQSSYVHVRYSTDGKTFADSQSSNLISGTGSSNWFGGMAPITNYSDPLINDERTTRMVTYKNIITVTPNTEYSLSTGSPVVHIHAILYDQTGTCVDTVSVGDSGTTTIPSNVYYARISVEATTLSEYANHTLIINAITNGVIKPRFEQPTGEIEWMGTCNSTNPIPSEVFDDYVWHKIKGDPGRDGQTLYGICDSASNSYGKLVTLSTGTISYPIEKGTTITVKFTNANTASSPLLKIDVTDGEYNGIKANSVATSSSNPYYWKAGTVIMFTYDGDYWVAVDTATTQMEMTNKGLVVGNWFGDTLQSNVLISPSDVQIRGGNKGEDIYASYGANTIYLGKHGYDQDTHIYMGYNPNTGESMVDMYYKDDANGFGETFVIDAPFAMQLLPEDIFNVQTSFNDGYNIGATTITSSSRYGDAAGNSLSQGVIELTTSLGSASTSITMETTQTLDVAISLVALGVDGGAGIKIDGLRSEVEIAGTLKSDYSITTTSSVSAGLLELTTSGINGGLRLPNNTAIYGTRKGETATRQLLHLSTGNVTAIGYGGYTNNDGSTALYGTDIILYSKTAEGTKATKYADYVATARPYYRINDTIAEGALWLTGFVHATTTDVYFVIPLAKPVMYLYKSGASKVFPKVDILESSTGFIIRQNGKFTHGSSSSTYVKPLSYPTATLSNDGSFIKICARFSSSASAIANEVCAITASLSIKLIDPT